MTLNLRYEDIAFDMFDVDLVEAAKKQVEFLHLVDKETNLYEGEVVRQAIFRYEKFWLPLLAINNNDHLHVAAPLDICWIWHCHMLSPLSYARDCNKIFGKILSHKLMGGQERKEGQITAEQLWNQMYPNTPFYNKDPITFEIPSDFVSCLTYDLEAAVSRQKVFYYQVSLPHYTDNKFLESSLVRYKKFLHMKRCYPDSFIVPCYDIDLIWHTHQLCPLSYKTDTVRLLGEHFNHDDSVNDRTEGSKLCRSMSETQTMWEELFNEKFTNIACMYRGLPPNGKLNNVSKDVVFQSSHKLANLEIQSIDVVRESANSMKKKICGVKLCTEFTSGIRIDLLKLKKPTKENRWTKETHNISVFDIDSRFCDIITVKVKQSGKIGIFKENVKGCVEMNPLLAKCMTMDEKIYEDTIVNLSDGSLLEIKYGITVTSLSTCVLTLHMGNFESCVMPEYIEQLWGPVTLPRLPEGTDNVCSVASHKIVNMTGAVTFTCRIIHSIPLLMSAIHVFCKDKLSVVCQLIGSDQLPVYSQVSDYKKCVTLDPVKFERSILIKNNDGDWGIALGQWSGFRRGRSGGISGDPGHLKVKLYKIANKSWIDLDLRNSYSLGSYKFTIDDTEVDLVNGTIMTKPDSKTIVEHIAVSFSVSLLHVLCQPHQNDWEPGQENKVVLRGRRRIQTLNVGKVAMFTAAGMAIATPSNHHIRKKYGRRYYPCYMGGATVLYLGDSSESDWGIDLDGCGNGCGYGFGSDCHADGDVNGDADGGDGVEGDGDGGDGDGGGCGGCGGCGGGDGFGGGGGDGGGWDSGGDGGGWDSGGGGDGGGWGGGGWGGDSGGGGDGGGGDGGGCGGGGCGGGGCGG
ncbi:uncharacterized protein LOC143084171 [Mytilus galloprovincialis]|uniref:uncharacterized protein LOC143084171 n=1 Tax=Mytilus galloprovincialis TaxID=29158 RepID=UPI003F7C6075